MSKKDYYEKNKDKISNKAKECYKNNRDALLNKARKYNQNNREIIREPANNKYKSLTEDKKYDDIKCARPQHDNFKSGLKRGIMIMMIMMIKEIIMIIKKIIIMMV